MNKLWKASALSGLIVATAVYAATGTVTKTATPANVQTFSTGTGNTSPEFFNLMGSDFPGSQLNATKKLTSVTYTVASYPGVTGDSPQLCYFQPFASSSTSCVTVTPGSSGSLANFNSLQFGNGAKVTITHNFTGTPNTTYRPSGNETVSFNFTY